MVFDSERIVSDRAASQTPPPRRDRILQLDRERRHVVGPHVTRIRDDRHGDHGLGPVAGGTINMSGTPPSAAGPTTSDRCHGDRRWYGQRVATVHHPSPLLILPSPAPLSARASSTVRMTPPSSCTGGVALCQCSFRSRQEPVRPILSIAKPVMLSWTALFLPRFGRGKTTI